MIDYSPDVLAAAPARSQRAAATRHRMARWPQMDLLITFAALLVGWGLGFGSQLWREKREARNAARIVYAELQSNLAKVETCHDTGEWDEESGFQRTAWETYGLVLLRVLDNVTLNELTRAYHLLNMIEPYLPDAFYKSEEIEFRLHSSHPEQRLKIALRAIAPYAGYRDEIIEFLDDTQRSNDHLFMAWVRDRHRQAEKIAPKSEYEAPGGSAPGSLMDVYSVAAELPDNPSASHGERATGMDDPCPCGSGIRFRRCHGRRPPSSKREDG